MTFREPELVVLQHDVPEHGLRSGDLGTLVHLHDAVAFEVEFVRAGGGTQAVLTLTERDVRAADDRDQFAVRPTGPNKRG
ncbi:MAG TPA: DUF4926 domain-containing protein [Gemmatimonadaceae bacterium]|nr:DUF4926 domain-containing protein [Gemmatimonadaceae bacterium]